MSAFTWIPLYQEIAKKVLEYEDKQDVLIAILREMRDKGMKVIQLLDEDVNGNKFDLDEIDPFTFFASFNRGITDENRKAILAEIKQYWMLKSEVPSDFNGIPVVNLQQSWFFLWAANRKPTDIPNLWQFARETIIQTPETFNRELFDICLDISLVGVGKLTMGMFWFNPYRYISFDGVMRSYLEKRFGSLKVKNANDYFQLHEKVKHEIGDDFPQISYTAWLEALEAWREKKRQLKEEINEGKESEETISVISSNDRRYWWLNANPKVWNFESLEIGETQTYSAYNERGNKRQKFAYFNEAKKGDFIVGYVTSPQKEIIAICEVTKELFDLNNNQYIEFKKVEKLRKPISYEELKANPLLSNSEPMINNQGSLFALTKEEFEVIRTIIDETVEPPTEKETYTREMALSEIFLDEKELDEVLDRLKRKKNLILQGAPGVGKTFIARRLAYLLMGEKDKERVESVQFHQSYSYEDFIQGYRPKEGGSFARKNGIFYEFCRKAQRDLEREYFFIIDEINRGNLSKIFGELMMLIESDKRGKDWAMPLTYSENADEKFYVPENLYIIGMMNTADRSLAMVDYALRRRFAFATLHPKFDNEKFVAFLEENGVSSELVGKINERMLNLNREIEKDERNLGIGFCIGHSYFCLFPDDKTPHENWYGEIINSEIKFLLDEYYPEKSDDVRKYVEDLLKP